MAMAKPRVVIRSLDLQWSDLGEDGSYMLLRPRTNDRKPSKKVSSGPSSSKEQPKSSGATSGASRLFTSPASGSTFNASPDEMRNARAALLYAAVQGDPKYPMANPPKRSGSHRSPSPPVSRVSGHPLSTMAIVRGPATVETEIDDIRKKERVSIPKEEVQYFNLRGKTGVSAGGHVFRGGTMTVAATGDVTGGVVKAHKGGQGYLMNRQHDGEFHHPIKEGEKEEKAIHSDNPSMMNVASLGTLEGPGIINLGAAEARKGRKIYQKYG